MKSIGIAILSLLFVPVLFTACKKETTQTTTKTIEGTWKGKYGFGNETPTVFFSFNIKPGGVIEELNSSGASKGSGTWTQTNSTFTAHYQWKAPLNTIFSVTAFYDKDNGKLDGFWGYGNEDDNGGEWTMTKQH
jgi:hypothetical protein